MMDWKTEMEMEGDAFNNFLKYALDFYSPPSTTNTSISLTKPETNIPNTFTQDYESSKPACDGQTGNRMASLTFSHHNQGLPSTHIPPPLQLPIASQVLAQTVCRIYHLYKQFLKQDSTTADDKSRLLMRRMKNKAAATKCRNKKKLKIKQLISQAKIKEEINIQLRQTVYQMEDILNSYPDTIDGI